MNPIAQRLAALPGSERARVLAELSDAEVRQLEIETEGLLDFIPRVSPDRVPPKHLQPLVDVIEASAEQPQKVVVSTPPQHGKTELCLHGLVWLARRNPARRHAYVTYERGRAGTISERTREIATAGGIGWKGTKQKWRFAIGGGSVVATGVDGPLTGEPVDGCLLVDDPHKNRAEAESATYRQRADDWFRSVALTRTHPSASVIVVATRWHPDDLIGRLLDRGWKSIILPAIDEQGRALWPEQRPLDFLHEKREDLGEYEWASLYQCVPRARGAAVFGDAHLYELAGRNWTGYRVALGVDTAYSAKKYSNWSVALVLIEVDGKFYVVDLVRAQCKTPAFNELIKGLKKKWGISRTRWYTNTTEEGVADLLDVRAVLAKEDKFVRAQPVAAAWNAGKVLVPRDAPWSSGLVSEVVSFTGIDDQHDDQVDALAAAYDALKTTVSYSGSGTEMPKRRM